MLGGRCWSWLLAEQPLRFADKCPWEVLDGDAWADLLICQPQFADKCPLDKLDGVDWVYLICEQPQFIERCCRAGCILDLPGWVLASMLCGEQCSGFDGCFRDFYEELEWIELENLIYSQPQIAKHFQWNNLDVGDWAWLLGKKPQFADKCDWGKLDGKDWCYLLLERPEFADNCLWEKLGNDDWNSLLEEQPQLSKLKPKT